MQDASNFEMLHEGLNTFASSGERSQLLLSELGQTNMTSVQMTLSLDPTTNDTTVKKSLATQKQSSISNLSGGNKELADLNKKVW